MVSNTKSVMWWHPGKRLHIQDGHYRDTPHHTLGVLMSRFTDHLTVCSNVCVDVTINNIINWLMVASAQKNAKDAENGDIIKWKHLSRYWSFVRGIQQSPADSPHKGQWHVALMFSLICARTDDWAHNRDADDLRYHRAHYDVTVMECTYYHAMNPSSVPAFTQYNVMFIFTEQKIWNSKLFIRLYIYCPYFRQLNILPTYLINHGFMWRNREPKAEHE